MYSFQLKKNHRARSRAEQRWLAACKFYMRRVPTGKGSSPLFAPSAKVVGGKKEKKKRIEQKHFPRARNDLYDLYSAVNIIKLISEIKSWSPAPPEFPRSLFSCFRNRTRGLLVENVINFPGKLIRSWTRYKWPREQS